MTPAAEAKKCTCCGPGMGIVNCDREAFIARLLQDDRDDLLRRPEPSIPVRPVAENLVFLFAGHSSAADLFGDERANLLFEK